MVLSASALLGFVGVMAATGGCSSIDINSLACWTVDFSSVVALTARNCVLTCIEGLHSLRHQRHVRNVM